MKNMKIQLKRFSSIVLLLLLGSVINVALGADYQYTYMVINLSGEIATQAKATQTAGTTPAIPDVIKNRLVSNDKYHYWAAGDVTQSGNTYTVNGGASELTELPTSTATIYVTYDYDNASSPIDLSGNTIYYIKSNAKYRSRKRNNSKRRIK